MMFAGACRHMLKRIRHGHGLQSYSKLCRAPLSASQLLVCNLYATRSNGHRLITSQVITCTSATNIRATPAALARSPRFIHNSSSRLIATDTANSKDKVELTKGGKVLRFIGWLGGFYSRKAVLTRGAKSLYESCVDTVQYEDFFEACNLPDTFQSWFLIAHLHVWFCLVRLKREGKDGTLVIKEIVSTFWDDVQQRMNVLGVNSGGVASWSLKELTHEFYGLTIAYEEGLLSDDKTLAAALWRNLIYDKSNTDPTQLARLVEYVRSQVKHMDELDSEQLLSEGRIRLLPFPGAKSNT